MDEVTRQFLTSHHLAIRLAVALLLGALIGLERGWEARGEAAGQRIAGIRTFALVGLLGGIAALLAERITVWAFPAIFLGVVVTSLIAYQARLREVPDYSITSMVGMLLTFCYGSLAVAVDPTLAAAAAVITTLILDNKHEIHGLLNKLQRHELDAGFKLLLISVVILPLLPNQNLGPGGALNPTAIWWLVVMIAAISFVGYFAMRLGGTRRGILFTSLFAGLSSSTALTLHFARLSRRSEGLGPLLAAGILIACGTMFPRILLYCLVINPALLGPLIVPVAVMAALLWLPALWLWHNHHDGAALAEPTPTQNPLELKSALLFGALLTAVMLLGEWLREWLGDAGIYLLSAVSGIADVDAITLSLTRMAEHSLALPTAVLGIVLAASVNNLVKAGLASVIGSRQLGWRVAGPMTVSLMAGLAVAWLI
ncbi:MAG: MgtC/SapB family protein [Onishia taeanensis]|uniref:MgtC/SapB family protein n=1 Tax=Halomonadaceae TaxID=28256 RepID=UPI0027146817|nr:MgtC/SapB family protein [Halomonas sp. I5-271120]